jgi:two-component system phosphate regulon sensor histidine kinase PhoR
VTLGLRERLFAGFAVVLAVTLALVALLTGREQERWLEARTRETLERSARLVLREIAHAPEAAAGNWPAFAAEMGDVLQCRVTLIARDGRVLGDSEVATDRTGALENHSGRPEVRAALAGQVGSAVRHSRTLGFDFMYVAVAAPAGALGVVRTSEPLTALATLRASLQRDTMLALLVALALGLVLVYGVAAWQAARMRSLQAIAARIGAGETGARALENPRDELGRLGRTLNQMATDLSTRLGTLSRERDEREHILAHMSEGVALIDAGGRIVRANQRLAELLDQTFVEPGRPFREFARAPELAEVLEVARRDGVVVERELRLWSRSLRTVRASATPLDGPEGRAILLVLHDLSEAERLNRVRQDFVANVSHELRTPLTSVRGYAETLLDGGLDDHEHREGFVRIIRDQTERLQALVDDLLSLSELERPGAELRLSRFDLREPVERQVAAFRDRAARAHLELSVEQGPAVVVSADRARIEQVVANLLDNAIKYTERGRVRVRVGGDALSAWCEVEDTGAGIPREDQGRVFERFYRVDKARSREKGGTGLGLSIVKHIVSLHGGEVSLESAPSVGSTFRFEIPRLALPED